jgi:hypothetical protein
LATSTVATRSSVRKSLRRQPFRAAEFFAGIGLLVEL